MCLGGCVHMCEPAAEVNEQSIVSSPETFLVLSDTEPLAVLELHQAGEASWPTNLSDLPVSSYHLSLTGVSVIPRFLF